MRAHTPTHCKEDREEDWREKIESEDQNRKSNIQQHNSWRKMKQGIGEEEVLKGSSQNWLHCQTESAHHTHNGQKQTHRRPHLSTTAGNTKAKRRLMKLPGKSKLVIYKESMNGLRFLNSNTARWQLYKILKFAVYSVPFLKTKGGPG